MTMPVRKTNYDTDELPWRNPRSRRQARRWLRPGEKAAWKLELWKELGI